MLPNQPVVMALMDVPSMVSLSEKEGLTLDKTTKIQLISYLLNAIGPYYGYEVIQEMMRKGLHNWANEDFEVDKILDYTNEKDGEYFLIKWKGWSSDFNSWEKKENLSNCSELLKAFEQQRQQNPKKKEIEEDIILETREEQLKTILNFLKERYYDDLLQEFIKNVKEKNRPKQLLRIKKAKMHGKHNKKSKMHKMHREELKKSFGSWVQKINQDLRSCEIKVENEVDLEGLPMDFVYISQRFHSSNIVEDTSQSAGCKCRGGNCLSEKKSCCGPSAGYRFAYTKNKRLKIHEGEAIYECNKKCSCDETCPNRVVQFGRKVPLCLFRTKDGRGWGVKATCMIPKGTFVEEYVGEVITSEEAERRGQAYDAEGLTYLFDLDFHEKDCAFTIDAKTYGNISHFINHSCDPNLAIFNVWIDNHDDRLPRIALFAIRDIKAKEELTFDYKMDAREKSLDELPFTDKDAKKECASSVSSAYFPALQNACSDDEKSLKRSIVSDSPKSFITADLNVPDCKIASEVINKDNSIISKFTPFLEKPATPAESYVINYRSDTPSASSASMNDIISKPSRNYTDPNARLLRSSSRKHGEETKNKTLKTESWVRSGGLSTHHHSKKLNCRAMKRAIMLCNPSSSKRLKIPCNCGTAICRKWLC